jgi:hypothetical protein
MPNKIILPYFMGLGDSLQFSTLPRKFTEAGFDVYLSNEIKFSNDGIKKLVWDLNPYIKGISNELPNAGDLDGVIYQNYGFGFIGNWEKIHELEPTSKIPDIYYYPQLNHDLADSTIIDISSKSLSKIYCVDILLEFIRKWYKNPIFVVGKNFNGIIGVNDKVIHINDIFQYCDIIYSCKKYVCLNSGGNSLAAGLTKYRDLDIDCIMIDSEQTRGMEVRRHFFYDCINYIWVKG